jgi:intracellular sulfur oxidation DsrE/DsrF family protein
VLVSGRADAATNDAGWLDKLVARGVKFGVCNMAITFYSGMVGEQMNMPAHKVKQEWLDGVLPGVTVVPSGVVAVNGAPSRGCTYCFAGWIEIIVRQQARTCRW